MIHARVDVELRDHERAHRAGRAMATWTWCLLYTRAKELDGFVPAVALRAAWVGEEQALLDMAVLVETGLAVECNAVSNNGHGWTLTNYAPRNETKADIDARRAATAHRVRRHRGSKTPAVSSDVTLLPTRLKRDTSDALLTRTEPEPDHSSIETEKVSELKGDLAYRAAYERGLEESGFVTAIPWGLAAQGSLNQSLLKFAKYDEGPTAGKSIRGAKLLEWIATRAREFGTFLLSKASEAQYYSNGEPKGFLRWLGEEERKERREAAQ